MNTAPAGAIPIQLFKSKFIHIFVGLTISFYRVEKCTFMKRCSLQKRVSKSTQKSLYKIAHLREFKDDLKMKSYFKVGESNWEPLISGYGTPTTERDGRGLV